MKPSSTSVNGQNIVHFNDENTHERFSLIAESLHDHPTSMQIAGKTVPIIGEYKLPNGWKTIIHALDPSLDNESVSIIVNLIKNKGLPLPTALLGCEVFNSVNTALTSLANEGTEPATLSYTTETGSAFGFSETLGVAVEAGFNFIVSGKITLNVELTANQSFSKTTTITSSATVPPKELLTIYQAILFANYYWVVELPELDIWFELNPVFRYKLFNRPAGVYSFTLLSNDQLLSNTFGIMSVPLKAK